MKTIAIFEDNYVHNLNPLVYFRPVYDLKTGISTLRKKIERKFSGSKIILHSRAYLKDMLKLENPNLQINTFDDEYILFINGRVIFEENVLNNLSNSETLFLSNNTIVAAYLLKKNYSKFINSDIIDFSPLIGKIPTEEISAKIINYPWDLFSINGEQIVEDLKHHDFKCFNNIFEGVYTRNSENIFLGENVDIHPSVFLDASDGPIIIDDNATIMSQTTIQGPTYIGKYSTIKIGAKIYHETTIGETCKVGGEIENSIIHGFANKQHEGFLGHSYISPWCNLGAGTNNSDLKNNYDKISLKQNGNNINTGLQFVGLTMGDHSKTAIGTQFNTGTIVGVSANIFGAGFPPRSIPSFAWGGSDFLKSYQLIKAKEVAKIVMNRRKLEFTEIHDKLFDTIFEMTEKERTVIKK